MILVDVINSGHPSTAGAWVTQGTLLQIFTVICHFLVIDERNYKVRISLLNVA